MYEYLLKKRCKSLCSYIVFFIFKNRMIEELLGKHPLVLKDSKLKDEYDFNKKR